MRINQFRAATVAALVVVAACLAGCAAQPAPASAPTPTASASPAPTPEAVVGPERLFGGDCGALFTVEELAAVVGSPLAVQATEWDLDPEYTAPAQVGGLGCHWATPETEAVMLSIVVLPTTAAGEGMTEKECVEQYGCLFGTVAGAFTLSAVLHDPAAALDTTRAASEALSAAFASRVAAERQPAPYVADGAWSTPLDCAGVDTQGLVAAAVGAPDATFAQWGGDSEPNSGYYRAATAASTGLCGLDGAEQSVKLWVQGGGAWVEEDVSTAPGATEVAVPGASAAYAVGDRLHVFSGADRFTLIVESGQPAGALLPAAAALLRDLDALG
jgi:hypothetical protein